MRHCSAGSSAPSPVAASTDRTTTEVVRTTSGWPEGDFCATSCCRSWTATSRQSWTAMQPSGWRTCERAMPATSAPARTPPIRPTSLASSGPGDSEALHGAAGRLWATATLAFRSVDGEARPPSSSSVTADQHTARTEPPDGPTHDADRHGLAAVTLGELALAVSGRYDGIRYRGRFDGTPTRRGKRSGHGRL